jgi:hypothetical protein
MMMMVVVIVVAATTTATPTNTNTYSRTGKPKIFTYTSRQIRSRVMTSSRGLNHRKMAFPWEKSCSATSPSKTARLAKKDPKVL